MRSSAAPRQRRPIRPAHRHRVPGAAPAGARRTHRGELVDGQRPATARAMRSPPPDVAPSARNDPPGRSSPPPSPPCSRTAHGRQQPERLGQPRRGRRLPGGSRRPAPGPPSARAAVTDELRDGLLEALQTHQGHGCSQAEATAAAIAEFGDPDTVATAFGPELGAVQARRVASACWSPGRWSGWPGSPRSWSTPCRHQLIGPWLALPLVGLALAVAGPALGLTVAATGRWAAGSASR